MADSGSKSKVTSQAAERPIKCRRLLARCCRCSFCLAACALTAARASLQTEAALCKRSPKQGAARAPVDLVRIRPCRKWCAARRGQGARGTGRTQRWHNPAAFRCAVLCSSAADKDNWGLSFYSLTRRRLLTCDRWHLTHRPAGVLQFLPQRSAADESQPRFISLQSGACDLLFFPPFKASNGEGPKFV